MRSRSTLPVLALLLLGLASCTTSSRMTFLTMPDETIPPGEGVDMAACEARYGKHDGVYLFVENTIEHSGTRERGMFDSSNWVYSRVEREKYIVFNPDNQGLCSYRTYIVPDNLYIRLTTPDGRIRSFGVGDLKEEKDADGDTRHALVFPDVVRGTIVEIGWEWELKYKYSAPPVSQDIPLQYVLPCERLSFTYAYPDWWSLRIKKIGPEGTVPLLKTLDPDGKKVVLSYEATDVPGLENEIYAPYFKEVADYLELQVTELEMAGMRLDLPDTWQEVAENFQDHLLEKSGKKSREVEEKTRQITADCDTDLERVDAILTWVQQNIESTSASRDGNYKKVLEEGSGNVFDITGLAQDMLSSVGLPAYYLLVHSAHDGYFDPGFVTSLQFSFPAVRVNVAGEDYVLFPYIENLPLNHTPPFLQGQTALMIESARMSEDWDLPEEFRAGEAVLWTLPGGNRAENTVTGVYELEISTTGAIAVVERKTARGALAYSLRQDLKDLDDEEREDFVAELVTYTDGHVEMESYEVRNLEAYREPLELELRYTIDNLVMVTPEEVVLQTGGLLSSLSRTSLAVDAEARRNPIRIAYDEQHDKHITIRHPAGWRIATALGDVDFANEFGAIAGRYRAEAGLLRIDQQLRLNRSEADRTRYEELLELIGRRARLNVPAIVFTVGDAAAAADGAVEPEPAAAAAEPAASPASD